MQYTICRQTFWLQKRTKLHRRTNLHSNMLLSISQMCAQVYLSQFKSLRYFLVLRLVISGIRLNREGYWIETLWTFYINVLNERKRKAGPNLPAGFIFLPNPRSKQWPTRCKNNVNLNNVKDMESIFIVFITWWY